MQYRFFLLILLLFALSIHTKAQVDIGIRGGISLATFMGDIENSSFKLGYEAGVTSNIPINRFSVQPALLLTRKGSKAEFSDETKTYQEKFALNYLEVPVLMAYTFNMGIRQFQLLAGPYVAYGLTGKYKREELIDESVIYRETENIQFVNDQVDREGFHIPFKNLDYGLKAGVGYINEHLQFQLVYSYGLGNLKAPFDGEKPDVHITNSSIHLSLNYFLEKEEEDE